MTIAPIRRLLIRHPSMSVDLGVMLCGLAVALYVVYVVDVFDNQMSLGPRESQIELDEALLLSAVMMVALLLFGIKHFLAGRREISRRAQAERQVRELAYQDGLTGLPNRRRFDEALKLAVASPPGPGPSTRSFCWTSTASSRSTTCTATAPATRPWWWSRSACCRPCATAT